MMLSDSEQSALLDLAISEPAQARRDAEARLAVPDIDAASESILLRVIGMALRAEREPAEAALVLNRSIAAADRAGDRRLRGLALLSLALAETYLGDNSRAATSIDAAVADLHGIERADARFQRALILQFAGRYDEALLDYRAALPVFKAAGRSDWIAHLLTNRGILHAFRGNHWQSGRDFEQARETFLARDDALGVATTDHNIAWLTTLRGDVVSALSAYGEAEHDLNDLGFPVDAVAMDQCEAMTAAGLFNQSADRAATVLDGLANRGMKLAEVETLVVLAEACAYAGDTERGGEAVRQALQILADQDNPRWLLRAQLAQLRLSDGQGLPAGQSLETFTKSLEAAGLTGWAHEAKILAARSRTRDGDLAAAEDLLRQSSPSRLPAELEVQWWLARAELHGAKGSGPSAVRAARSGVKAVRSRQAVANTSEVRAHIGRQLGALAAIGIEQGVARNRPEQILQWLEDLMWTPPPPSLAPDPTLRTASFELRAITHELVREQGGENPVRRRQLVDRQRQLHRRLRALQEKSSGGVEVHEELDLDALAGRDGLRAYAVAGETLFGVAAQEGRLQLSDLGPVAPLAASFRQLDLTMKSLLHVRFSESKLQRCLARAEEIDRALGHPGHHDGAETIVYLPPVFGPVPLGMLPSLAGRRILHATSLRSHERSPDGRSRLLAIAGPNLEHADPEVLAVADQYQDRTVLVDAEATCEATLAGMETADIVHVASHGRRSPDNPFFDALQLADGPLFTHELDWLKRAPSVAVLATCESAVEHSLDQSQRLGVMPSLDRVGVWRTIASVYQLPDNEATVAVMVELHRRLACSEDPTAALAACAADPGLEPQARVIAASLVCRGRPT